jgi:hypothetical protein
MDEPSFSDITVESSPREDPLLIDVTHLILEISSDGKVIGTANLSSRESTRGVWNANQMLVM